MDLRKWLRFKPGVNPAGAHPMLVSALATAADVYRKVGTPCWVTSMCDGIHQSNSFHYMLMAADLRTKNLRPDQKDDVVAALRLRLGEGWDIVLEHRGHTQEHIHMEWDDGREHAERYLSELQENFYERLGAAVA